MSQDSRERRLATDRRTVLKAAGAAGLFATVPWTTGRVAAISGTTTLDFDGYEFTDELPRPGVLRPTGRNGRNVHYDVALSEFGQKVLPDSMYDDLGLDDTTVWGYEGSYPGPTIEATPKRQIEVEYDFSALPGEHLLSGSVDPNVHGAGGGVPEVRIVTHVHGGHVPPEADGNPEAWAGYEDGDLVTYEDFNDDDPQVPYTPVKEYPNIQRPGTLWYHDHAMGITRLNVYAGLAGFYLLRDPLERVLPSGDYEIPIVIQDRTFTDDGSLFYPPGGPPYEAEFFADVPVVNGKAYPKLTVEPRPYRLRILNGSNNRVFDLKLYNEDEGTYTDVPPFQQIGVDLGFIRGVVDVGPNGTIGGDGTPIESLLLGGAERADLIVDFGDYAGTSFMVKNGAQRADNGETVPYAGEPFDAEAADMPDIMRIEVATEVTEAFVETMPLEKFLTTIVPKYPEPKATDSGVTRTNTLASAAYEVAPGITYDTHFLNLDRFEAPTDSKPTLGTSEVWELINTTRDSHPIHLHLVDFDVIERESFTWNDSPHGADDWQQAAQRYVNDPENEPKPDIADYVTFSGNPIPSDPNVSTHKDTVLVDPGEVVRIEAGFVRFTGDYVWHCHILEHEDQEMMRPFEVVDL